MSPLSPLHPVVVCEKVSLRKLLSTLILFVLPGTKFRKSDIPEGGYDWFHRIPNNGKSTRPTAQSVN